MLVKRSRRSVLANQIMLGDEAGADAAKLKSLEGELFDLEKRIATHNKVY